jgi:hypothetical protein
MARLRPRFGAGLAAGAQVSIDVLRFVYATSVVITGLSKVYPVITYQIDETMLLCQPVGPNTYPEMLQRLGLANPPERVAQNSFNQIEDAQRNPAVCGDAVLQILTKFWMKDCVVLVWTSGQSLMWSGQAQPRGVILQQTVMSLCAVRHVRVRLVGVPRLVKLA